MPRIREVFAAGTADFAELIRISGLNPRRHLRFADWSGLDFSGADLRGFDFTGARLVGCEFRDAMIERAIFDQAEIDQAEFDPEKRTTLRSAKDWEAYVKAWQKAPLPPGDGHLPALSVFQDAPFAPEMVVVPAGFFTMGETEEDHRKFDDRRVSGIDQSEEVGVPSFAVSRFTVTRAEWKHFIRDGGRDAFAEYDGARGRWKHGERAAHEARGQWADEDLEPWNMPALNLSWHDAKAYAAWLCAMTGKTYRLLHIAEWEYAARAGTKTAYWWGDAITPGLANYNPTYKDPSSLSTEEISALVNQQESDRRRVVPVDRYAPNPWGLYQVHGNVWEWCDGWPIPEDQTRDEDNPDFSIDPAMMVAPTRGGAYTFGAAQCRAAAISMHLGLEHNGTTGLRIARDLV
jgi:formylglycine-generating enzyme required for sulfatase activity